ncbi:FtsZ-interacting cell division protein YlmF [Clostridium saccharobutylicum]|nr:FtsZ-interacting cell division protein YlmF [Clostridium saccharobutylicum]
MSNVLSKVKSLLGFEDYEDYEDYEDEEYEDEVREEEESIEPVITNKKNSKVVNIHTSSATKVTITKPVDYEEATEICEALKKQKNCFGKYNSFRIENCSKIIRLYKWIVLCIRRRITTN